jgi:hypothetical protein
MVLKIRITFYSILFYSKKPPNVRPSEITASRLAATAKTKSVLHDEHWALRLAGVMAMSTQDRLAKGFRMQEQLLKESVVASFPPLIRVCLLLNWSATRASWQPSLNPPLHTPPIAGMVCSARRTQFSQADRKEEACYSDRPGGVHGQIQRPK